jgi:hypothetical protein
MTDHDFAKQAFRQFQYLTLPLHVREDHVEQAWVNANRRLETRFA